jgi:hypothetical protein
VAQPKIYIIGFLAILNFRFSRKTHSSEMQSYPLDTRGRRSHVASNAGARELEEGKRSVRVDVETHRSVSMLPDSPRPNVSRRPTDSGQWLIVSEGQSRSVDR